MKKIILGILCSTPILARMPQVENFKQKMTQTDFSKSLPRPSKPRKPLKVKRKGLTGLSERKTYTQMTFPELRLAIDLQKEKRSFETAIKYLERLIVLCDDLDIKAEILVEVADIMFEQGHYEDAEKKYTEFAQLYPGNSHVEHALYYTIVCLSNGILSPDRDQTKTEQTIERADAFLERAAIFTTHAPKVREMRHNACKTLVENQFNVSQTCMNLGNYEGAQKRLELVRANWLAELPEIEIGLALLEVQLGSEFEGFKPPEAALKVAELSQQLKPKKVDMVARF